MTIERDRDEIEMVCDRLGVRFSESFDADDLQSLVDAAMAKGWRVTRERGEWRHYSPDASAAEFEFAHFEDID